MKTVIVRVLNEVGLHARPAVLFVKKASQFRSFIQVRNLTTNSDWSVANSLIKLLTLGVEAGHEIEICIDGEDEDQALQALTRLIETNFAES